MQTSKKRMHNPSSYSLVVVLATVQMLAVLVAGQYATQPKLSGLSKERADFYAAYNYFVTPASRVPPPLLDETTRTIVENFSSVITKQDEKAIAESYLVLANQVKQIVDKVVASNIENTPEIEQLKQTLLQIVNYLASKSDHPSYDMLKSSLKDITRQMNGTSENPQADAEWIVPAIKIANFAANALDGIGTYSKKISLVSRFVAGPVANKLEKFGLHGVSKFARKAGNKIDRFTKRLQPFERKAAQKIAPFVKSKPFQVAKRTLNVVSGAVDIKSGLHVLGMAKKVKLPSSFSALKSGLKRASSFSKNKKSMWNAIKKTGKYANSFKKNFAKANTWSKVKSTKNFATGTLSIKKGLSPGRRTNPRQNNRRPSYRRQRSNRRPTQGFRRHRHNGMRRSFGRQYNTRRPNTSRRYYSRPSSRQNRRLSYYTRQRRPSYSRSRQRASSFRRSRNTRPTQHRMAHRRSFSYSRRPSRTFRRTGGSRSFRPSSRPTFSRRSMRSYSRPSRASSFRSSRRSFSRSGRRR